MLHIPGLRQPEHLLADVADTDHTERLAGQSETKEIALLFPAAFTRQLVLLGEPMRHGKNQRHDAARHGSAYAVGRDGQQNALLGERRHIDRVVTYAEASDELEPAVRCGNRLRAHARAEDADGVVARSRLGGELWLDSRQVFPFDRWIIEHLECIAPKDGLAARAQDVAGDTDFEFFSHSSASLLQNQSANAEAAEERRERRENLRNNDGGMPVSPPTSEQPERVAEIH